MGQNDYDTLKENEFLRISRLISQYITIYLFR